MKTAPLFMTLLAVLGSSLTCGSAIAESTIRIGDGHLNLPQSLSADGRFVSLDDEVYDRRSGTFIPIDGGVPLATPGGRFIAFQSRSSTLVDGDTNGRSDVFLLDRQTDAIRLISVSSAGAQGNHNSETVSISADGGLVLFKSYANNLVPGDTGLGQDLFLRDWRKGLTKRVDVRRVHAELSQDGHFVAFNGVAPDNNSQRPSDVFVRNLQTGTAERVSVDSNEVPFRILSTGTAISTDGRFVAFATDAQFFDRIHGPIFVRDRLAGVTERIDVNSNGDAANMGMTSLAASMSKDGRFVAFTSEATNLVPNTPAMVMPTGRF